MGREPLPGQRHGALEVRFLRPAHLRRYSFFKRVDKEIGVGLGLHVAAYDVALSANAIGDEQQDVTAPLPVLSVYSQFALTNHWAIGTRVDLFVLSYDNFDGRLTSIGIDVMYQRFRGPLLFMNVSF